MTDFSSQQKHPGALIAIRRQRLEHLLSIRLVSPPTSHIEPEPREYLINQAQDLYWEELSWERLTDDEDVTRSGLVELTFPGFLAFVQGLLLRDVMDDSLAPANPRPEVVEDILLFLEQRYSDLENAADAEGIFEREIAVRLMDLTLYRLHEISVEDMNRLDLAGIDDEE